MLGKAVALGWVLALLIGLLTVSEVFMVALIAEL